MRRRADARRETGVLRAAPAMPHHRQNSIVRILTRFILECCTGRPCTSTSTQSTPRHPSSAARAKPTGPPPTINTSASFGNRTVVLATITPPSAGKDGTIQPVRQTPLLPHQDPAARACRGMGSDCGQPRLRLGRGPKLIRSQRLRAVHPRPSAADEANRPRTKVGTRGPRKLER